MTSEGPGATYAAAGVDIEAGDRAVELMKKQVAKATRPEVVGDLGGFAGLFALDLSKYRKPLLASSTDGVGTKLAVAQAMDKHDTIGYDLVGMVVDDLVVCGAEPLFLLDYISCGKVVPERMAEIVGGVADACALAGCALVGGETAEHPGLMQEHEYDLAGCGIGIVESDEVLGSERVREGDVIIGMAASGLHSNGFALARHVLLTAARMRLDAHVDELGTTLGEALLTPTRIYAKDCLALIAECDVHAFAHITGGGLAGNVARVVPDGLTAEMRRGEWTIPAMFHLIEDRGRIDEIEMERTFNMGIGMVAIVAPDDADRAMALLGHRKLPAFVIGDVVAGDGSARLTGTHPA